MAFTPYYNALFTKPLIRQLVAIVQKNMQAALDIVTGVPGSLQSFAEYNLAMLPPENPPALIVTPPPVLKIDENSQQTERSGGQIHFLMAIANQDRNILAEQVQDYLRALSYVLDTEGSNAAASQSDMYKVLPISLPFLTITETTPIQIGTLVYMRVTGHELGGLYSPAFGGFIQTAGLTLRIDLEEI